MGYRLQITPAMQRPQRIIFVSDGGRAEEGQQDGAFVVYSQFVDAAFVLVDDFLNGV